jgi:uncharacterized FAD-dependent dehydrogenase
MAYYIYKELKISIYENLDPIQKTAEVLKIRIEDITNFKIIKRSMDLRYANTDIFYVYTVIFTLKCQKPENKNLEIYKPAEKEERQISLSEIKTDIRPVIVGCGPAGLFCALTMLEYGIMPVVLERGKRVAQREQDINKFFADRIINEESNVCFGEGGAGTFSDGKLTSRSKDARQNFVLNTFVKYGADKSILYDSKPHLGTDVLKKIITGMTDDLISMGAEFRFEAKADNIILKDNSVRAVVGADFEIETNAIVLAAGHSARDVYKMLDGIGAAMQSKPFAVGVRIEHKREDIDRAAYKKHYLKAVLPAAEYILKYRDVSGRGVYTFCNCPGGVVIPCITEDGMLCVNGMSYSKRDGENSNSAIAVTVGREDYKASTPLAGIEYQRSIEHKTYVLGGSNYSAPVMYVQDLLKHSNSKGFSEVRPSYMPGVNIADLRECVPENIFVCIKNALADFGRKLYGFDSCNAILTAVESRTSAPVRVLRDENLQSVNIKGLYVAGEGSGYAGGIVSSAIDGIKAAQGCIKTIFDKGR